ncbi:liver carboxylesterase-like isoform X4 [Delphinapterus leucas]|uniref:Carboxylic ester hydrolase n=1 Tax=Delphinapterus leucas TaxID=9749 RepID=A0A7F8KA15_DELLE|nr:liver carboxylesterase-like isoform X4 [Delphinapterus leucas]
MWLFALVLSSVTTFTALAGQPPSPPVVDTAQGRVLGKYVSLEGFAQPVAVFLGVPFARPPLGSLRFAPPQPAEPWIFVKNTTSYPPMCSQDPVAGQVISELFTNRKENINLRFSEDCLYLNIYTPADLRKRSRLPVMVWIHGGGLMLGGASTYDGLALSAHENVVVVTVQYRLGIWGFFSTGDEHSRGNWGHLDQLAALHWVQENIANFGGDPGSVTIFGESAGGESVSILSSPFLPTVLDGVLLPKMPEEILAEKNFHPVPYVVGINKQECGWILPMFMGYSFSEGKLDQKTATSFVWKSYPILNIHEELTPVATDKYLGGMDNPAIKKDLFLDLIADGMFGVPSVNVARRHRDAGAPTYMYEFQYHPSFSSGMKPKTVMGDHGDELFSVFGAPFVKDGASEEETNLSKMVMKFWANFAQNGNPNGEGLPPWPVYDQKEGHLQIGVTTQAAEKLKDKEVAFWNELLSKEAAKKPPQLKHAEL